MRSYDKRHILPLFGAGDPSLLGHHDDTNSNDDERPTVYTSKNVNNFSNFSKGWLAIAKLKPLSLFISLFKHCQMLSKALIIEE